MPAKRILAVAVALGGLLVGAPASAIDCKTWTSMDTGAREAWLEERICWGVFESPDARSYDVDKSLLLRCMRQRIPAITSDFDAICAEGQRRDQDALDQRLQSHFWSCLH